DLREIDQLVAELVAFYEKKETRVILLSEYGINTVSRPVYINRALREAGLIAVRIEAGRELVDAGASAAFAAPDHQIAHVYVNDPAQLSRVKALLEAIPGVAEVLDEAGKKAHHLDHERSGDLVAVAEPDSWFAYYYWLDDTKKPDYAQVVDIHRKPGYDPVELFMDQTNPLIKAKAGYKLARKLLGFRYLMDVISLDATLVKGSHGGVNIGREYYPVLITDQPVPQGELDAVDVYNVIWQHLKGPVLQPARSEKL
ncbi:MAG TPA: alkaline phosphatase family protein, partial [Fibrella sp.]